MNAPATASGAPIARHTSVRGQPARYVEAGEGLPLVLLHGLGLDASEWDAHIPLLATRGLRCIAPDLPGFGWTSGPRWGLHVDGTARWLLDFVDAIDLERATWLGQSINAQVALEVTAAAPDRAAGLVVVSPTGVRARLPRLRQFGALLLDAPREPLELVTLVLRRYARASKRRILGTWYQAARHDPLARAGAVRCPALVSGGDHDPIAPVSYLEALATALRARVEILPDGAHGAALSQRERFVRLVAEFVLAEAGP
ncbi:MAG: alpha/beta fold hydrolase [Longimicrobiales bacterium]